MSWSLQIRNGDLVTDGAKLGVVTRQAKMLQDLSHWILERMGTDSLHPAYGSLIDGGIAPSGQYVEGVIGSGDMEFAEVLVEQELRRIVGEYQQYQLARAKNDRLTSGKATLTADEVVIDINEILIVQDADELQVQVVLTTASNQSAILEVPLSPEASTELTNGDSA